MKILDRAKAIQQLLIKDKEATQGLLGFPLQGAAIAAALGGIKSEAWRKYMTIHASNEAQLKRLTGEDDLSVSSYVRESSAYMVANATCGGLTPEGLTQFIDPRIDDGLDHTTDPNFTRFIEYNIEAPAPDGD